MSGPKLFLGRQPILDRQQNLIAYEILFRSADVATANVSDVSQASASVILDSLSSFGLDDVIGRQRGFFNVHRDMLMSDALELLPKDKVVLELLETITPDAEVAARCYDLKTRGFSLALDDHTYDPDYELLYPSMDIVKVDILATGMERLPADLAALRRWPMRMLAEKVESQEVFKACFDLGFDFFQGYYFARPTVLNRRRVDLSGLTLIKLLNQVIAEAEVEEIENTFRQNPDMAYTLLRLVNSVALGLRERIKTLRHAIVILGRKQLLRWAQLALFATKSNPDAPSPLLEIAALRGRLLELLVERDGKGTADREMADRAFMTGILSLVDVLFETSMEQVVGELNLTEDVRAALLKREGPLGELLRVAESLEETDLGELTQLLERAHVDAGTLVDAHLSAIQWTGSLYQST
jgi:c-di-GMP-related signal transduction protein